MDSGIGKRIIGEALDLLFPGSIYCICCGNLIDDTRSYSLCDHCITHIRWKIEEPEIRKNVRFVSCTDYGIYERSIIFALKYDGHKYIADTISEIMADRLGSIGYVPSKNTIIVPVPLHHKKLSERGFNQSEIIGRKLAVRLGIPLVDALERNRYTTPMRSLGPLERYYNVRGSMKVKDDEDVRGKEILLVDDFMTTGSTVMSCHEALVSSGARGTTALVFASRDNIDTL